MRAGAAFKASAKLLSAVAALLAGQASFGASAASAAAAVPGELVTDDQPEGPKFLPDPEDLALPEERVLLNAFLADLARSKPSDAATMLAVLDRSLAKLREPTKLRGYVQFLRSSILSYENRRPESLEAIEESIRLLPDHSGPLLIAASLYAYANQVGKGVDFFLRASRVDPESARAIDDYEIDNFMRRLSTERDDRRIRALSDRLLEIGWLGNSLASRSSLAREAIIRRVEDGDIAGARALVPKLLVPSHSYSLLMNKAYREIWPDIEAWAGPLLERQWLIYLKEARERWTASKDVDTVRDYTLALVSAGHDDSVLRDVLPLFGKDLDEHRDQDLMFVVTQVAGALARKGRLNEVDGLFERAQKVWPFGSQANALNIAANRAKYLLFQGKVEEGLKMMDAAIADARKWQVNPDALGAMHHYRACMLHELGRDEEAGVSMTLSMSVSYPASIASLHLCMGNHDQARQALLDGLKVESSRGNVIGFVQPAEERPIQSEYGVKMDRVLSALKADPELRAAVEEYGRILHFSVNDGAPRDPALPLPPAR